MGPLLLVAFASCLLAVPVAAGQAAAVSGLVVADPAAGMYHVPACPRTKGIRSPLLLSPTQAEQRQLKPHDCRRAIAEAQRTGDREQLVWVDLKTKRYHLAGCSLVGLPRAQVRLEQAAAKYKPCNACKPPSPK